MKATGYVKLLKIGFLRIYLGFILNILRMFYKINECFNIMGQRAHWAWRANQYFQERVIDTLSWSSKPHDLNLAGATQNELKRKLKRSNESKKNYRRCTKKWKIIISKYIISLRISMRSRVQTVVNSKD